MTELWTCTDCPAEIDFDARREHMHDEHGVSYALADEVCPHCGEQACDRAKALEGKPWRELTAEQRYHAWQAEEAERRSGVSG